MQELSDNNLRIVDRIDGKELKKFLPDAERMMNVFRKPDDRNYYYGVLKMVNPVFGDGVDKNKILHILQVITEQRGYRIHVFAMMDDSILLIMSRNKEMDQDGETGFMDELTQNCVNYFESKGTDRKKLLRESFAWDALSGKDEILDKCFSIHSMPTKQGYIKRGGKHFWSSEMQYDLSFEWSFLDMSGILGLLDEDPVKAQKLYRIDQKIRRKNEKND